MRGRIVDARRLREQLVGLDRPGGMGHAARARPRREEACMIRTLPAALAAGLVAGAVWAAPAPRVSIASFQQLATPLPYPYDERADADAAVFAAKQQAAAEHKLLL